MPILLVVLDVVRTPGGGTAGLHDDARIGRNVGIEEFVEVLASESLLRFEVGSTHIYKDGARNTARLSGTSTENHTNKG